MLNIFNEKLKFKDKEISKTILGTATFTGETYFGHRSRLYELDLENEQENIAKIIRLEYELSLYKDSLNYIRDSLGQDLFIANYKLAKIKEYNRLAGNGNNIKFLRGWINRTLNE